MNEIAQYRAWKHGVFHTTLNPMGPGCVRIHLIPPRYVPFFPTFYTLILNGYYIMPIGYSWAILLSLFIEHINQYEGKPMSDADMDQVIRDASRQARKTYCLTPLRNLESDLREILGTLCDVAKGENPPDATGFIPIRQYAKRMSAPHRMDLLLSSMSTETGEWNCNLKCVHCYAAGQTLAKTRELSTDEWKKVIDTCREAGIPQLTFTGGEPTLRRDLVELVTYAQWFVTRLNTNGVLLSPDLCEKLKHASLDSCQITLYSHNGAVHDKLVGADLPGSRGPFEKTLEGLRNALNAGLNISVNTPLCAENADYETTLQFLHGEGVQYVSCSGLIQTGNAASDHSITSQLSNEQMREILQQASNYCAHHDMEIHFTSPGWLTSFDFKELGLLAPMCGACLSNMAVASDGTVLPCQSWMGVDAALGNMLETTWRNIWEHPMCEKVRAMSDHEATTCPLRTGLFTSRGEADHA